MKKILITGKTGVLSNAVTGWLTQKDGFDVHRISLKGQDWANQSFSGIDCIVHIAGITPQNAQNEDDYINVNVLLTKELAHKAKQDGVSQFVYISSMAVYGMTQQMDAQAGIITEQTTCQPENIYGKSKLQAESVLEALRDEKFHISVIRVPSIYGKGKTEYLDQYKYLAKKLPFIPLAFQEHYKSAIYIDNLCEVIYLTIEKKFFGIVCPNDGDYAAVDFCRAIYPDRKCFRLPGLAIEMLLSQNERIQDYYGAVHYSKSLSNVFEAKYRVVPFTEAVRRSYE